MNPDYSTSMDKIATGLTTMESTSAQRAKVALRALSTNAQGYGLTEAEILISLGEGRDLLDPFGMFVTFWGRLMKYLGTPFAVALSLLSLLALVDWLVDRVDDVGKWIAKLFMGIPGMFFWKSARGALGQEDSVYDQDGPLQRVAGAGLRGFIYGLLPAPIAGAVAAAMSMVTGVTGAITSHPVSAGVGAGVGTAVGLAGSGMLGTLGRGAAVVGKGIAKVGGGAWGLVRKLGGFLLKDEVPDGFTNDEINDIATAMDASPEEVRVLLQDLMEADGDDDDNDND